MPSPETTPRRDLNRAHWQRSEAAAVYSQLFEHLLTTLDGSITDPIIVDHMAETEPGADPFASVNHLVHLPYLMYLQGDLPGFTDSDAFQKTVARRIHSYTYEGSLARTMEEGLKTTMAFPANFLKLVDTEYSQVYGRPLVKNLRSAYQCYASAEFSDLIHQAAFAPNGFWPGRLSELPVDINGHTKKRHFESMPAFIPDNRSRLGLRLDTTKLLAAIASNNRRGDSTVIPSEPDLTKLATSGCPVRLRRAQYNDSPIDQIRLDELSDVSGRSATELQATIPRSGIQAGLDFTADLLRRTVILDKHRKIGHLTVKATKVGRGRASS